MKKLTRRKAIELIGGITVITTFSLSGCCFIRKLLNNPCVPALMWKQDRISWWKERKKQREKERQTDILSGKRTHIELPKPFLMCQPLYNIPMEAGPHGYVIDQFNNNMHLNVWNEFYLLIKNIGNAPAWNCIVETYECPLHNYYGRRFDELTLNDRVIVNIMPGESKEVKLKFRITLASLGGIWTRCYDPFCDPGILVTDQFERHNSGFVWEHWNN